jgi:hypothetical protein
MKRVENGGRSQSLWGIGLFLSCMFVRNDCLAANASIFFADSSSNTPAPERQISKVGDRVSVWVDKCDAEVVTFEEDPRSSRFVQELGQILKTEIGLVAGAPSPCTRGTRKSYLSKPLANERGTVTVEAKDSDGKELASMKITTGPKEHLFISLDLPVDNKKTLKYDSTSQSLQPSGSTPQLYWAVNYQGGDVIDTSKLSGLGRMSGKLMLQASSKPLDSFGVGVGFVLPKIELLNVDLSSFSIFAGHFWTKQDQLNNGKVNVNGSYSGMWRFGVSYSLDDALKWVKK